ncbi:MAG: flavodoxin family protein [Abditibacteriota bacterium]|nr:flavodoxin family protein [Abditibacteriota bacterium]
MKVLILNGSPRAGGNTAAMCDAFREGAEAAGHTVETVQAGRMDIGGCRACEYCHGEGQGACVQKDGMQKIYPLLAEAEFVVLASPIYYFAPTAQLQAAVQRMYALMRPEKVRRMALLLSSGSPGVYNAAVCQYKDMLSYLGIGNSGIITASGRENKSPDKLEEIRAFARTI